MKNKNKEVLKKIRNYPTVDTLQSGDAFNFIAENPSKLYIYNSFQETVTDVETGRIFFADDEIGSINNWTEAPIKKVKATIIIDACSACSACDTCNYNIEPEEEEESEEEEEEELEPEVNRDVFSEMKSPITKWGQKQELPYMHRRIDCSNLVHIPDEFLEALDLKPGDIIKMELEESTIMITKSEGEEY